MFFSDITFIAPTFVSLNTPYVVYIRTSKLDLPVSLAITFRNQSIAESLGRNRHNYRSATFNKVGEGFRTNITFGFKILMKHDNLCHDQVLSVRRIDKKSFIFVQLDKPIYKPGDTIKFRIISLNNTMQPFKPNNVNVTLRNPENAFMQDRTNLKNVNQLGLFNASFILDENAAEGNWSIFIKIGKVNITKMFAVQKYTLPLYELKVRTKPKIDLKESDLIVDVEAVYSFGGFIPGNATIIVSSITGIVTKNATIDNIHTFKFSLSDELAIGIIRGIFVRLNVTVIFKDYLSLFTYAKTKLVDVYLKKSCKIEVIALQNYTEGIPYTFNAILTDFDGNVIKQSSVAVEAKFGNAKGNCSNHAIKSSNIRNSVASFNVNNPRKCEGQNFIEISYKNKLCKATYDVLKTDEALRGITLISSPEQYVELL